MSQVSDSDLHDFVDERLDEERRQAVAAAIAQDPGLEAKVRDYQAQMSGLHELYDSILDEPVPDRLAAVLSETAASPVARPRRFAWVAQAAVLAFVFVLGGGGGWILHQQFSPRSPLLEPVVRQAVLAHKILEEAAPKDEEVLGKVVDAVSEGRISNPFRVPLRAPASAGLTNFVPVTFQDVVGATGPTTQLLYRNDEGAQVSLYVQAHSQGSGLPFETGVVDGYDVLFWIDGPLVYVLTGEKGETELIDLAESFYTAPTIRPAREPSWK